MTGITTRQIVYNTATASVMGHKRPMNEIFDNNMLPKRVRAAVKEGQITEDEYITMMEYARWLPHGKRQLKLNYPELRNMLVSHDLEKAPLTKTSGMNKGGKTAIEGPKALTQREHLATILNKNRIRKAAFPGTNPNFTSFANRFGLK